MTTHSYCSSFATTAPAGRDIRSLLPQTTLKEYSIARCSHKHLSSGPNLNKPTKPTQNSLEFTLRKYPPQVALTPPLSDSYAAPAGQCLRPIPSTDDGTSVFNTSSRAKTPKGDICASVYSLTWLSNFPETKLLIFLKCCRYFVFFSGSVNNGRTTVESGFPCSSTIPESLSDKIKSGPNFIKSGILSPTPRYISFFVNNGRTL